MNKLHFSLKEMASITEGYWENISSSQIEINGFNNTLDTLKKGDAFVIINDNFISSNTDVNYEEKVKEAITKEISAIVIDNRFEIKTNIPILRVDNVYLAMMKLSQYAIDETSAKKVFVLGSRGKK